MCRPINEALQAIRVMHNFYEATSENVQLICDLERIQRDLLIVTNENSRGA